MPQKTLLNFIKIIACGVVVVVVFSSCTPSIYKAIDDQYIPTELDIRSKKLILISSKFVEDNKLFIQLINSKKRTDFERSLNQLNDLNKKRFLQAVQFIVDKNYQNAYYNLITLNKADFDCEVQILLADCLFEQRVDTVNFSRRYQQAIDCSSNPIIKSIAIKRHRFFKYGI